MVYQQNTIRTRPLCSGSRELMTRTKIILPKESGCWWQEVPSRDSGFVEPDCAVTGIFRWAAFLSGTASMQGSCTGQKCRWRTRAYAVYLQSDCIGSFGQSRQSVHRRQWISYWLWMRRDRKSARLPETSGCFWQMRRLNRSDILTVRIFVQSFPESLQVS